MTDLSWKDRRAGNRKQGDTPTGVILITLLPMVMALWALIERGLR